MPFEILAGLIVIACAVQAWSWWDIRRMKRRIRELQRDR